MLWLASRNRAQRKPRHSSTVSIVPLRRGDTAPVIEVADDAQGRGVGKAMLAALARSADGAVIELFEALVHPGNAAVHAWARSLGVWPSTLGAEPLRVPVSHLLDLSVIRRTA